MGAQSVTVRVQQLPVEFRVGGWGFQSLLEVGVELRGSPIRGFPHSHLRVGTLCTLPHPERSCRLIVRLIVLISTRRCPTATASSVSRRGAPTDPAEADMRSPTADPIARVLCA